MGYGISNYHDVTAIYAQLSALMRRPAIPIRREAMERYLRCFDEKCGKSKVIITDARQYIPGGVQHNLAFNYPFPLVIDRAEGPYLYDIDGNRYIDFLQAGGPTILGSNSPHSSRPGHPSPHSLRPFDRTLSRVRAHPGQGNPPSHARG